jgi:hypothetical protein
MSMTPALNELSRLGQIRGISRLTIFRVQNTARLLRNGIIVVAVALSSMTLFLTTLRLGRDALGAQMDMLRISVFLILSPLQGYKFVPDQNQQLPEVGNANDRAMLLNGTTVAVQKITPKCRSTCGHLSSIPQREEQTSPVLQLRERKGRGVGDRFSWCTPFQLASPIGNERIVFFTLQYDLPRSRDGLRDLFQEFDRDIRGAI